MKNIRVIYTYFTKLGESGGLNGYKQNDNGFRKGDSGEA